MEAVFWYLLITMAIDTNKEYNPGDLAGYAGGSGETWGGKEFFIGDTKYRINDTGHGTRRVSITGSRAQDAVNSSNAARDALVQKQNAEQEGLFKTYENTRASQEKLPDIYNRLINEAGVPGLQQTVGVVKGEIFKTKDLIDRLEEDVNSRTSGFLVSDAQRRRQITAENAPLETQLGRLATGLSPVQEALSAALGNASTQFGLTTQQQDRDLEPLKMRIAAVSDKFAREMTGFNQDRQDQLTVLLKKMDQDQALSQQEWQSTQQLAAEERQWERTKEQIALESANAIKLKQTAAPSTAVVGGGNTTSYYDSSSPSNVGTKSAPSYSDWLNLGKKPQSSSGINYNYYG